MTDNELHDALKACACLADFVMDAKDCNRFLHEMMHDENTELDKCDLARVDAVCNVIDMASKIACDEYHRLDAQTTTEMYKRSEKKNDDACD